MTRQSITTTESRPPGQRLSLTVPFVHAIADLFEKMLGCPVEVAQIVAGGGSDDRTMICSRIDYTGGYSGSMSLRVEPAAAAAMARGFTGMDFDLRSQEMADVIGEMANMIAGAAKAKLGELTRISTPTVWVSSQPHATPPQCAVIPCRVGDASFTVEISLVQIQAA